MFIICSISVFVVQCDRDDEEKTLTLEKRFHFYFSFVCLFLETFIDWIDVLLMAMIYLHPFRELK